MVTIPGSSSPREPKYAQGANLQRFSGSPNRASWRPPRPGPPAETANTAPRVRNNRYPACSKLFARATLSDYFGVAGRGIPGTAPGDYSHGASSRDFRPRDRRAVWAIGSPAESARTRISVWRCTSRGPLRSAPVRWSSCPCWVSRKTHTNTPSTALGYRSGRFMSVLSGETRCNSWLVFDA